MDKHLTALYYEKAFALMVVDFMPCQAKSHVKIFLSRGRVQSFRLNSSSLRTQVVYTEEDDYYSDLQNTTRDARGGPFDVIPSRRPTQLLGVIRSINSDIAQANVLHGLLIKVTHTC